MTILILLFMLWFGIHSNGEIIMQEKSDIAKFNEPVINLNDYVGNDPNQREKLNYLRQEFRKSFNDNIYKEPGRQWYQTAFVEYFAFMYDQSFYDRFKCEYRIDELIDEGEREFGGYDFIILWQSYPRMGIDARNQFDYYRDMPGGLDGLRKVVERAHERGVKVFVNYHPWDIGTRREDRSDAEVLADIIKAINADGVFLDTMSTADKEFRSAIEHANPNVVFDPEGIPYPLQGEFITGSWQQFRLVAPPELMTIRWLEPRYSLRGIDRTSDDRIPLLSLNFFNGCGHVVWENIFGWWNPWKAKERDFLKKCIKILRENKDAFIDANWQPYIETLVKDVYAHKWSSGNKIVYTLLNTTDIKIEGDIIALPYSGEQKYYDVWSGNKIEIREENNRIILNFAIDPKSPSCIIALPADASAPQYTEIPRSYETQYRQRVSLDALEPRPVFRTPTAKKDDKIQGMVFIPGGRFVMNVRHNVHYAVEGACYGDVSTWRSKNHPPQYFWLKPYFIDITEVTNAEYKAFLEATYYCPSDLTNFLKLWERPIGAESEPWKWEYPKDKANHPVVWVDLDDARAYAKWIGKRLPKEEEWQYAAQGHELTLAAPIPPSERMEKWQYENLGANHRLWPWGNEFDPLLCNGDSQDTTPVDKYPEGASPFGCLDMCGNVWEWTESERDDGHTRYAIIRGGSHKTFHGSIWYTANSAQPCDVHEKILLMYPGLDRCSNIGFRCVKDVSE